jgi:hypothetical protein
MSIGAVPVRRIRERGSEGFRTHEWLVCFVPWTRPTGAGNRITEERDY